MMSADETVAGLRDFLENPPGSDFIEFEGQWRTGTELAAVARGVATLLDGAGVPKDVAIGVVIRNHPETAAALIGIIAVGRPVTMVYSHQASTLIASNVEKLDLAVVVAEERDWSEDLRRCLGGSRLGISLPDGLGIPRLVAPVEHLLEPRRTHSETVVEVLTSGTTGPPKNIVLSLSALGRGIGMLAQGVGTGQAPQVELVYVPLASIGGILMTLGYAIARTRLCLFDRFEVNAWADAVRRHRPATTGVTAPVIRAVLDNDIEPEWLESLQSVFGGAGPLEADIRQRFSELYKIDVCWGYGATEFAGTLATWTPQLKAELGGDRPNSVGRVLPGLEARITDPETGETLDTNHLGRLEARVPHLGNDWIRTNDQAKIDADGILYIFGRLDGAINRGGFKVLPEVVAEALRRHPAVADAAVIGIRDNRLGEVPVAMVELLASPGSITPEELRMFTREHLPSPSVPAEVRIVEELPRNAMLKVDVPALRRLWDSQEAGA